MSERMTAASAPGIPGYSLYGRRTRPEMVKAYREHYQLVKEDAEAALAVTDEDIKVHTFVGAWARNKMEEVTE